MARAAGVEVKEASSGVKTVTAVSTAIMGVLGITKRGKTDKAYSAVSYDEWVRKYGIKNVNGEAAYQVEQFFKNGGSTVYTARAIHNPDASPATQAQTVYLPGVAFGIQHSAGSVTLNDTNIRIGIDGGAMLEIDVTNGGSAGNSYKLSTLASNINAAILASSEYGSTISTHLVCDVVDQGRRLRFTGKSVSSTAEVAFEASTYSDCTEDLLGNAILGTHSGANGDSYFDLLAVFVGDDGNDISIKIDRNPNYDARYNITVYDSRSQSESYDAVSIDQSNAAETYYFETVIENSTLLLDINVNGTGSLMTDDALWGYGEFNLASGDEALSDGDSGITEADRVTAFLNGLSLFDDIDEILNITCADAEHNLGAANCAIVQKAIADYYNDTEREKDTFGIFSPPDSFKTQTDVSQIVGYNVDTLNVTHSYAAMYWPWVKVYDTVRKITRSISPVGTIAGRYAATDVNQNVGKAPAGIVDGAMLGVTGLSVENLKKGHRKILSGGRVNPLISSSRTGLAIWESYTESLDSEWQNIQARRLFMYLERSIYNSIFFAVQENNGPSLWIKITMMINNFLNNRFRDGYFAGAKATEAYYVICDASNNPQSKIDEGEVNVKVGVAPNEPSRFIVLTFAQKTAS